MHVRCAPGWWRMCLLVLYFSPDHLRDPANFAAVANKLICSPVTQVLVFTKVRSSAVPWAAVKQQADLWRLLSEAQIYRVWPDRSCGTADPPRHPGMDRQDHSVGRQASDQRALQRPCGGELCRCQVRLRMLPAAACMLLSLRLPL
jgi:hypothetical protein